MDSNTNKLGLIFVFLNYKQGKISMAGKDVFAFSIYNNQHRVFPGGFSTVNDDTLACYTTPLACTQWVLTNGNMDYLHCNGLFWNGKTTCKEE